MKTVLRLALLFPIALVWLRGAESSDPAADRVIAAVRAADEERLAATVAADQARLEAVFSDDLRYAHSSGHVDTKASYIAALTGSKTSHDGFEYKERLFRPVGPGIVLMTGRVVSRTTSGTQKRTLDLNYLAVWREELGHWRFLAWQSCANPTEAVAATK